MLCILCRSVYWRVVQWHLGLLTAGFMEWWKLDKLDGWIFIADSFQDFHSFHVLSGRDSRSEGNLMKLINVLFSSKQHSALLWLARDAAAHNRAVRTGDLVQLYTTPSHQPEHIMCHSHNGDLYSVYTSALLWLTSYLYITLRKWFILKDLTFLSIGYVKDFWKIILRSWFISYYSKTDNAIL